MQHRHVLGIVIILTACCVLYYSRDILLLKSVRTFYNFSSSMNRSTRHHVVILARRPSTKVLRHFNVLLKANVDAFVMCDEDPSKFNSSTNRTLYVGDEYLAAYGMKRNRVWDRVFIWLYNQTSIDYVWLMEDDVTWSNIRYIIDLFDKYANNKADLLSRNIIYKSPQTAGWIWWPKTFLSLLPENRWSGSLNMLSRVSRRLINAHQYYTIQLLNVIKQKNITNIDRNYYYQEFFIPTSANMFNLTMVIYNHSNMDVHVFPLSEDHIRASLSTGKQIFHPVKHDSQLLSNATVI